MDMRNESSDSGDHPGSLYAAPQSAQDAGKGGSLFIAISRGCIAFFLALPMCSFVTLLLPHFGSALTIPLCIGLVVAAIGIGRNHLLILLCLMIASYFMAMEYSRSNIDRFCNSINDSTNPATLPDLAKQARVDFRSGSRPDTPGKFYGAARDPFSMGEYGCRLRFDDTKILSRRLGF